MKTLQWIYDSTLYSVKFGIFLMVLVGLYIAIGSGSASLREWLEMDEMQLFNAWPMLALMGLLVLNLLVVTFSRIPFTPPRYGVWMVHAGIVILVFGMAYYFKNKTEGRAFVKLGDQIDHFYDRFERSMYARVGVRTSAPMQLASLPRFKEYEEGSPRLERADLQGLQPRMGGIDRQTGQSTLLPLHEALGLAEPVEVDVVAYWPYAAVDSHFEQDPTATVPTLRLSQLDPRTGQPTSRMLQADEAGGGIAVFSDGTVVEHRHVPNAETLQRLSAAPSRLHAIAVELDGQEVYRGTVQVGAEVNVPGYHMHIAEFMPDFPMSGTGKPVDALVIHINPGHDADNPHARDELLADDSEAPLRFNRMVLHNNDLQTDFKLGVEGAGPMGQRQTTPLDARLVVKYTVNDPMNILPRGGAAARHILATADGVPGLLHVAVPGEGSPTVRAMERGLSEIRLTTDTGPTELLIERRDGLTSYTDVHPTNSDDRVQTEAEVGLHQVLRVRVRSGDWEQTVNLPFTRFALLEPWQSEPIRIPGSNSAFQLGFGHTRRMLPMPVKLERFELEPYPGGLPQAGSLMRDFRSHISLKNPRTGQTVEGVAKLNSPVYLNEGGHWLGMSWLLFQAEWDPAGQRWTVLGVGNRPGIWTMVSGFVLIVCGLMYAFYLKPVIIRRMKQKALDRAAAAGKRLPEKKPLATPV